MKRNKITSILTFSVAINWLSHLEKRVLLKHILGYFINYVCLAVFRKELVKKEHTGGCPSQVPFGFNCMDFCPEMELYLILSLLGERNILAEPMPVRQIK